MIINKILYILILIISVIFFLLYNGDFSLYIMVFVFVLPLILQIGLIISRFTLKITLNSDSKIFVKNENCRFKISIKNPTPFPFSSGKIKIDYQNKFSKQENSMYITIPIHPFTTENIDFFLSSEFCGIMSVKVSSIKIYDCIRLFSAYIKSKSNCPVFILPSGEYKIIQNSESNVFSENNNIFLKNKSGDDPSEIFDLTDFSYGDKESRIHWSLSARQGKLITKHYSKPASTSILIISNLSASFVNNSIEALDTALELIHAITLNFINSEVPVEICYFNNEISDICKIKVSDEETLLITLPEIISNACSISNESIFDYIPLLSDNFSKLVYISNDDIYKNEYFNKYSSKNLFIFINNNISKIKLRETDEAIIYEIPPQSLDENIDKIFI